MSPAEAAARLRTSMQGEATKVATDTLELPPFGPMYTRSIISGIQDSGKTILARHLVAGTHAVVIEPHGTFGVQHGEHYITKEPDNAGSVIATLPTRGKLTLVIDEFPRYTRGDAGRRFLNTFMNYWDEHKHYKQNIVVITRRLTQIVNADIIDLANILYIFALPGSNDYSVLEAISKGLGQEVQSLSRYEYVIVDTQRRYIRMPPVMEMEQIEDSKEDSRTDTSR